MDYQNVQYSVKNVHVFVLVFYMLLLCSFFRLKELFQVKNGVTTSLLFFFLKMSKIWVGWTTVNGEKKDDVLSLIEQRESTLLTQWPVEDLQYTVEMW